MNEVLDGYNTYLSAADRHEPGTHIPQQASNVPTHVPVDKELCNETTP